MKAINLTQHNPTREQAQAIEFVAVEEQDRAEVVKLITFDVADFSDMENQIAIRSNALAQIAKKYGADVAMIGGAPFFQSALENALQAEKVGFIYALSARESVESVVDGKVVKTAVFAHKGFYGKNGNGNTLSL